MKLTRINRFLLTRDKAGVVLGIWVFSVIVHNAIFALIGWEEMFFFLSAVVVIPCYLLVSGAYTLFKNLK